MRAYVLFAILWFTLVFSVAGVLGFYTSATREARYDLCQAALERCGAHVRSLAKECNK